MRTQFGNIEWPACQGQGWVHMKVAPKSGGKTNLLLVIVSFKHVNHMEEALLPCEF